MNDMRNNMHMLIFDKTYHTNINEILYEPNILPVLQ